MCLRLIFVAAVLGLGSLEPALARVKLITLPVRQRVEVQLDHAHATLVEEERVVPLVAGVNQVDFSWANTRIDPGTIVFRVLGPDAKSDLEARVLSVSYPPGENALVWDVSATASGSARVRISYLLGGLDKGYNYRAVAGHDEKTLTLSQYLRVKNFAGEAFAAATVNLGAGEHFDKPIGLNQTKEMLVARTPGVPIVKTYTCDLARFGYLDPALKKLRVPMHYVLTNDAANKLGLAPLPAGKVRIFQRDAPDADATTAFLGEDWGGFTPIDDKMRLYLGVARDIVVKRTIDSRQDTRIAGNLYDREVIIKYEIENFKDQPATLNVAETIEQIRQALGMASGQPAQWTLGPQTTFTGPPDAEESTQQRLVFHTDLPARTGDKADVIVRKLHLIFKNQW